MLIECDVLTDKFINSVLYFANLFWSNFLEVREVETQNFRRNVRTFLLYVSAKKVAQCFVKQVSSCVVSLSCSTFFSIDFSQEVASYIFWQFAHNVYRKVVFSFCITDFYSVAIFGNQPTRVAHLTTHFGIERSARENHLIVLFILLNKTTIAKNLSVALSLIVAYELDIAFAHHYPVASFHCSSITCTVFLFLHFGIEVVDIECKSILFENQLSKVERESVCVIQCEGIDTTDFSFTCRFSFSHHTVEKTNTSFECTEE